MNSQYNLNFPEPKRFSTKSEYILSLTGDGKMSKSVVGSYISLMDNLDEIRNRLAHVPTDTGKGKIIPTARGIASLLQLVGIFQGKEKFEEYEKNYLNKGIRYKDLKEELAQAIFEMEKLWN